MPHHFLCLHLSPFFCSRHGSSEPSLYLWDNCTYRGQNQRPSSISFRMIVRWQPPYKRNAPNKKLQGKLEACPMLMAGFSSDVCHLCRLAASSVPFTQSLVLLPRLDASQIYSQTVYNTHLDMFLVFKCYALRNEYLVLFCKKQNGFHRGIFTGCKLADSDVKL